MEAKLELFDWSRNDMPEFVTVWPTPGVSRAIRSTSSATSWVRSSEAASGNWMLTINRPWSCWGMKPLGAWSKVHPVSPSRPT